MRDTPNTHAAYMFSQIWEYFSPKSAIFRFRCMFDKSSETHQLDIQIYSIKVYVCLNIFFMIFMEFDFSHRPVDPKISNKLLEIMDSQVFLIKNWKSHRIYMVRKSSFLPARYTGRYPSGLLMWFA